MLVEVPWYNDYSAIVSANLAITQSKDPAVFPTTDVTAQATSKMLITGSQFIQGVALANIAMYFNQGFYVDEKTAAGSDIPFRGYKELRDSALKRLDDAIASAGANTFKLPTSFLNISGWTNVQLAQVANTEAARLFPVDDEPARRVGVTTTTRIPALAARLARLAVDVDELAQQIIAEPLTDRDELFLASPTAHLALLRK